MNTPFDLVGSVSPGRDSWRFKVRVVRLWSVSAFLYLDQVNSIEMVLIDEKGAKIHATIRRQLLYLFASKVAEGNVYKMSYFSVMPESGLYRTTTHPYKLMFEMKTKVQISESSKIDLYGLSPTSIDEICGYGPDHDFLVDVVALITGVTEEREYVRDGKVCKMIVLELSDKSGKCGCTLFGAYANQLKDLLAKNDVGLPTVVVQFAKIKMFAGKVSVQNVMNATKIHVNPSIPEVVSFKQAMVVDGAETSVSIAHIGHPIKPSFEEEFLSKYPKTSIGHLLELANDGIYIVSAVVVGLVDGQDWWYPACKCHKSLTPDSGSFFCKKCDKHVFKMVPRFRVKLMVDDGTAECVFVVFDGDMNILVGKHCQELVAGAKAQNAGFCPPELEIVKGKRVKRICSDVSIIETFDAMSIPNEEVDEEVDEEVGEGVDEEVDMIVECVEETQLGGFVGGLIISPKFSKAEHGVNVGAGTVESEVIMV
ncbi:replication factor-A carboxy-terminal domain protein [Trifolium pratense]|uniref:Replication factor-A carboxy-terminal domain protein n=1 Tax=Trifolium pratense TaxID=57577 RepID=A0A2K3MZX3_TRIPR|nr:replication factor-A carboxy-terminal domain protein [Trifolium pratense]